MAGGRGEGRSAGSRLSHTRGDGSAAMVDVGSKAVTAREARAEAFVRVSGALETAIRANAVAKGSVLEVARLAGIQAAKRTDELIPLCHSLPLDSVDVEATLEDGRVRLVATARTHARTGVEMEALTAVAVAALTVVDMGKAIDKGMVVEGVRVLEKRGGRGGVYIAGPAGGQAAGVSNEHEEREGGEGHGGGGEDGVRDAGKAGRGARRRGGRA